MEVAVRELQAKVKLQEEQIAYLTSEIEIIKQAPAIATDVPRGTVSNTKQSVTRR